MLPKQAEKTKIFSLKKFVLDLEKNLHIIAWLELQPVSAQSHELLFHDYLKPT